MKNVLGSPAGTTPCGFFAVAAGAALPLAATPPFCAEQLHAHGPLPLTAEAVPEEHRLVVGALVSVSPLDEPHLPLTGVAAPVTAKVAAALSQYASDANPAVNTPIFKVYVPAAAGATKFQEYAFALAA